MNAVIELKIGQLIGVPAADNNHGCSDYAILRYDGSGKATVVEAQSCTSCWQAGHGHDHNFATVGDVWNVEPSKLVHITADADNWQWTSDVAWQLS